MALAHILLVDDEVHVVQAIAGLLRSQDDLSAEIFEAENAQEALFWLEHSRIDLMITDIEMPDIDGIALVKIVKDRWPNCRTIVLTAHSKFDYVYQAFRLGIVAYILKTESDDMILARVREILAKQNAEFLRVGEELILRDAQGNYRPSKENDALHKLLKGKEENASGLLHKMGFRTINMCLVLVGLNLQNVTEATIKRLFDHFIGPRMSRMIFSMVDGFLCVLLEPTAGAGTTDSQIVFWLEGMLESIQDAIAIDRVCETSIVLCQPVHHSEDLQELLHRALETLTEYHDKNKGILYTLPQNPDSLPSVDRDPIQMIQEYIETHLSEDISLKRLSEMTCFNASYLSRLFHQRTGQTLNRYIAGVKMEHICELMMNEDYPIGRIAEMTGFESRSYFNRFVRKMYNQTPQQLRDDLLGRVTPR